MFGAYLYLNEAEWFSPAMLAQGTGAEVTVMWNDRAKFDRGVVAECRVVWRNLGAAGYCPCLEVFSDAWGIVGKDQVLSDVLREFDGGNPTPEAFCAALTHHGYVDVTPRAPQEAAPHDQ